MSPDGLIPTARLRWVKREHRAPSMVNDAVGVLTLVDVLQQFWAQDMPAYMRDHATGEWRDVELVVEGG
jgi:hypothetical protein